MSGVFITAYSFIAALIGAGFASGQEILSFFVVHGKFGGAGIILSGLIFGFFAFFVLNSCRKYGITDYNLLLEKTMGSAAAVISRALTGIFLLCSYSVMIACFGEMMYFLFDYDKRITSVIFAAVCTIIVRFGAERALRLNGILGIVIAAGVIAAVLYILRYREHQTFAPQVSAIVSGAGYSGYNLIGAGVILAKLSGNIKSKKDAALAGIISGVVPMIMMTLIYALLNIYYKYINLGELPMLTMAMRENSLITAFYGIMLVLAVVTTAISDVVGLSELLGRREVSLIFISAAAFAISGAGFSTVINTAYKFCGYAGIALVFYMVINLKKLKNGEI